MMLALSIRNKLGFIDGTLPKPTGDLLQSWTRNNNIVIAWILNSVSKGISSSIFFTDSTYAIWEDLKERFQRKNGPRIFQLKHDLATLSQDQQTVTMYLSKLKGIWDEYVTYKPGCSCGGCTCGGQKKIEEFFQYEYLMSFLMGLNESYGHARSQILLMDPAPPINKALSLITQKEHQRLAPIPPSPPAIGLAVNQTTPTAANQKTTTPITQSSNSRQRKDRPICTHCGIQGHTVDRCYKLHDIHLDIVKKEGNVIQAPNRSSKILCHK